MGVLRLLTKTPLCRRSKLNDYRALYGNEEKIDSVYSIGLKMPSCEGREIVFLDWG